MFSFIIDLIQTITLLFIAMAIYIAVIMPYKSDKQDKMYPSTYWLEKLSDNFFKDK